jgi:bifunctional polynucleotide phosphatase/kinase
MSIKFININNAKFRKNMIAFDFDWTLVQPKNNKTFPTSVNDWQWLYSNIPKKIQEYYNDKSNENMIVIFTNQTKEWKIEQIKQCLETLNIPIFVIIPMSKENHKPNKMLLDELYKNILENNLYNENNLNDINNPDSNLEIDKEKSFFVGDALGRKTDHSDCDKLFAENLEIKCYSPEDIFVDKNNLNKIIEFPEITLSNNKEIIIMMGYPGSGKSSIAKHICSNNKNYIHIERDMYKTVPKMKKKALEYITDGKSIIFDATNSNKKNRVVFVEFAKKYNYDIRCIHVNTSLDESYKRNLLRPDDKKVPKIAYSVYKKYFQEPNESEGFILITI